MASGINIYSFVQISKIIIPDIWEEKNYFGYPKTSTVRILDIQKSYFGYKKQQFLISENKNLFQISKIVIMDIRNNHFGYPK